MIAVFGGTFDPVHYGHLRSAWEVREALGDCDFRWLPAGNPPHRDGAVTAVAHRLEMLRLALQGIGAFTIDARETERPGPSYMVDTLTELRGEAGPRPLCLVVGQDSAASLDQWRDWRQLLDLAHLVVMRRPGHPMDCADALDRAYRARSVSDVSSLRQSPAGRVWHAKVTQLEISSSLIRDMLSGGRSPRFMLPDEVLDYAVGMGLYGARPA